MFDEVLDVAVMKLLVEAFPQGEEGGVEGGVQESEKEESGEEFLCRREQSRQTPIMLSS